MTAEDTKRTKKDKKIKIRIPLPIRPEKPHSTRKGKKGYDRKRDKTHIEIMLKTASLL